jgi:hypothetical protein
VPIIALQDVESSQINAVGYDPETLTLAVQFKGWKGELGATYHYANVTAEDFEAFKSADSLGRHFTRHIKPFPEKFPYTKVADKPSAQQEAA